MDFAANRVAGSFLPQDDWQNCVFTGRWEAASGGTLDLTEKATGAVLGRVGHADAADIAAAGRRARVAQPGWAATSFEERAAILRRAAALLGEHAPELSGWIMRETGGIGPKAGFELHMVEGILQKSASLPSEPQGYVLPSASGEMSFARRLPHGVVGVISPFNFPLILSARAVAPALAVGNAVILKPDLQTPVSGGLILAQVFAAAGLPAGVLQVLPGGAEAGQAMCTDPEINMISFTGSTAAGRKVGAACGAALKRVQLELGGKNALLVLEDADLDLAASAIAFGCWFHQGQICMTTGRVLVHENIADALIARLVGKAEHLPVGDPASGQVALGPVINDRQRDRVHAIVTESVAAGAKLLAGGTHDRLFYRPTVLADVAPGMRAFDEEIFGPVAAITRFSDDAQAVALANRNEYGLSAGIISRDLARALAIGNQLDVGLLHINDQTVGDQPWIPFGGRRASGNGEGIGGPANWDAFSQWQWVTMKSQPGPYPF